MKVWNVFSVQAKAQFSWGYIYIHESLKCFLFSGKGTRGSWERAVPQVPRQVHRRKLPKEGRTDYNLENIFIVLDFNANGYPSVLAVEHWGKRQMGTWAVIEFAFSDPWKRPSRQWDSPLEEGNASKKGGSS